jgi:tetratricopeptide (TPR) repeat protein
MKRRTVSLCLIARDEESAIGQAIKSALALVDEVIVVDTGSRDNTRIIAEGYGARIVDFAWRDDFAAARNAALDEAFGDWVLILDADERLEPLRPVDFQRLLANETAAGYRVERVDARTDAVAASRPVRLFRNQPEVRFRYPIHEQIAPALAGWAAERGLAILDAPVVVVHTGSARAGVADRRDRNQRILRRAIQEYPAEPYFDYQLACESLVTLDDEVLPVAGLAATQAALERAWQKALALPPAERSGLSYGADLIARLAACRLAAGDAGSALAAVAAGRREWGPHPSVTLVEIAAATRLLAESGADLPPEQARRLAADTRREIGRLREGDLPPDALPADPRGWNLYPLRYEGELALLEGRVDEASELFEKALTIDGGYSSAWLGLAECARCAGDRKRALQLYLRAVTASEWNHRAWLRGSVVLDELGFHDNAASWRRQVAVHFPEHPACAGAAGGAPAALPQPQPAL